MGNGQIDGMADQVLEPDAKASRWSQEYEACLAGVRARRGPGFNKSDITSKRGKSPSSLSGDGGLGGYRYDVKCAAASPRVRDDTPVVGISGA